MLVAGPVLRNEEFKVLDRGIGDFPREQGSLSPVTRQTDRIGSGEQASLVYRALRVIELGMVLDQVGNVSCVPCLKILESKWIFYSRIILSGCYYRSIVSDSVIETVHECLVNSPETVVGMSRSPVCLSLDFG